jgi:hypothetical protein
MLYSEYKKFYIFIEGSCPNLRQARRELLFVQFLESLHPGDAALMAMVKDKQLPYPNITPELVDEAYPRLLGNWKKEIKPVLPNPWQAKSETAFNLGEKAILGEWQGLSPMQAPSPEVFKMREQDLQASAITLPKEKKPLSAKHLAGLEKARQKRKANIAARKAAQGK